MLFRLAFAVAYFFSELRVRELVTGGRVGVGLCEKDVDLYPDRVEFWLRRSKTDQKG